MAPLTIPATARPSDVRQKRGDGMKREYKKPTLTKREQLSKVTAQDAPSVFKPDNGPTVPLD